ncbi:UDP-glycosyltransferase 91A1-like [Arachis stenosperma]|uniref:UDP-glycosyltransferase 91A1-like n=1 Tax=Arachis stenosperma TaxID=217475 RepID=UPI0025ACE4C0|nr:UDP-glycosyltransferase 91A1-like [Arachis stenosperma]
MVFPDPLLHVDYSAIMARDDEKLHIVIFPWLAFGHIIPNLELAKHIAQKGHKVSFVSTTRNIERLPKPPPNLASLITYVKLPLPKVDNLPENAEATADVPYDVVQYLKKAYDALQHPFSHYLESSNADWIFYDFAAFWVPSLASRFGMKTVFYSIFTPPFMAFMGPASYMIDNDPIRTKPENFTVPPPWVPFSSTVAFHYYEIMRIVDSVSDNDSGTSDTYRLGASIENCDLVAVRGCTELEPEWFQVLRDIYRKPVLPVGQLPSSGFNGGDENENDTWRGIKEWLDKQAHGRVVYVAFGSEAKPRQEEVNEIALGLEKSELPFFWVLRVRRGASDTEVLKLPEGFEERTKGRGVVWRGWAPQLKILGHGSVGGFLSHSGWTSVVEAVQNETPLVLLTFLADQGINARVLEERKMGYPVPRDKLNGSFTSDSVARSVRLVVLDDGGRVYRDNIKEVKDLFLNNQRQQKYIHQLLCHLRSRSHPKKGERVFRD